MKLVVPELSLVVLIGVSGSGKSSFGRAHFKPTEVLSSDSCRALVSDDENDQSATTDAFDVLHFIAAKRLAAGRLTVVDATNVQPEARKPLVALAREHDVLPVAIVFNIPVQLCQERNRARPDRNFGPHVIRRQAEQLRRSLRGLQREGFRHVYVLPSPEDVAAATIERQRLWNNRRFDHGPFDIIGDVHGALPSLPTCCRSSATMSNQWTGRSATMWSHHQTVERSLSATWSTVAHKSRMCCAWSWAWLPPVQPYAYPAIMTSSCCASSAARMCK